MFNQQTRQCQTCKKEFRISPDDFAFYERFESFSPKKCVVCIWKHLLAFWVFGRFRKTASALSGKSIITTFPETVKFPIYAHEEWASDSWDPLDFGQEYDFSKSFFEQFAELQARVPHPHQSGIKNVDCQWSDDVWSSKNCYLCRSLLDCENVSYGYRIFFCKDSFDLAYCFNMELSYDCLYCFKSYRVRHSFDARECIDSAFLHDCRNCQNCFMCWNLRNKEYHILNKPYSKEAYFEKLKEFDTRSRSGVQKIKNDFNKIIAAEAVHRVDYNVKILNSTGNFLLECKDCFSCYSLEKSENCRYVFRGIQNKDVAFSVGSIVENSVFSMVDGYGYKTMATFHCANCRESAYLDYCENCEYCFGCVGLRKKRYCILNKQYSEQAYRETLAQIKSKMRQDNEWAEFFPLSMAYCGYNFSLAHIYFPQTVEEVEGMGGFWQKQPEQTYEGIDGDSLPDSIDDATDEILQKIIICPETKGRFNIAKHEFEFCKKYGIPLPNRYPDYRTVQRFKPMAEMMTATGDGACFFCGKNIKHSYPAGWNYKKIACAECYREKIS